MCSKNISDRVEKKEIKRIRKYEKPSNCWTRELCQAENPYKARYETDRDREIDQRVAEEDLPDWEKESGCWHNGIFYKAI